MAQILDENFYAKEPEKNSLFSKYMLSISGSILIIGIIFKIQHWPMSGPMIIINSGIINGHLLGRLIKRKPSLEIILSVLLGIIILNLLILYIYFNSTAIFIYFICFLILLVIELIRRKKYKRI